jgi:hypothetical protein
LLLLARLMLGAAPVRAAEPAEVTAGLGEVEVLEDGRGKQMDLVVRFPYRRFDLLPTFLPELAPLLGAITTSRGAIYVYAGMGAELRLPGRWRLCPSFSAGLYHQGEGQDLGGLLQFRSALELSYTLDPRRRLGVSLDHISNGGIFGRNPGSESLTFTYSAKLGRRR